MISSFSSFVEFFAAIYVTMAINNDFCSNFWTPQYYKEMESLLDTYDFSGSSSIHDKLMGEIKAKYEMMQNHAHFRGFILLTLCVFLLMFMGYENESDSGSVRHYVPLLYSMVFVGFIVLFSSILLVKWKWTVLCVCAYLLFYSVLKFGDWDVVANNCLSIFLFEYKCLLLIGVIIIPIVYQIFVYWLHSSIYKGYLKHHVSLEYNRFKNSMAGIKARDKSRVDEIYMKAWSEEAFVSSGDPTLTCLYSVLNKQLLIIASPSYYKLLSSWVKFHINKISPKLKKEIIGSMTEPVVGESAFPQNMSIQNESIRLSVLDFSKEYADYLLWKKTAGKKNSVTAFCHLRNIPLKDMKAWLRVNNPEKKQHE